MAITHGPRLGLTRWSEDTDEWNREDFDADNALVEDLVALDDQGLIENRPPAGIRGRYYYATDIDQTYRDSGTAWAPVGNTPIGGGMLWFIPGNAPAGYAEPIGQALSRTTYAALFALWGTFHGNGDGNTTFNMPDLRGRSIVGLDPSQAEFNPVGKAGGEKAHTLTVQELAKHHHGQVVGVPPSGAFGPGQRADYDVDANAIAYPQGLDTYDAGGDQPHNNLSPYKVARYLIRVL
jgi:microcystin-dependent protein